jgi:LmbE family N-acetylglucosaminyl deacetylase
MPGLMVLLAHPDDEFFCAGLLAALARRGVPLHLVYWTRGEGGGSPRRRLLARMLPAAWHPRATEARRSAKIFGASVDFLGAIDPVPNPDLRAPADSPDAFRTRLAGPLQVHQPEVLLTHGSAGEYGHPAHSQLHRLARLASEAGSLPLLSFCAHAPELNPVPTFLNRDDAAHIVFDAAPWREEKRSVLHAHHSQKAAFEALVGGGVDNILDATRFEGYRAWHKVASGVSQLTDWLGPEAAIVAHRV